MNSLSKTGRKWICKKLKMIDNDSSQFIKDKKAFCDRMSLLRVMYNIDKLVDTYNKELKTFDSEEEYNDFLEERVKLIKKKTEDAIKLGIMTEHLICGNSDSNDINFFKVNNKYKEEKGTLLRLYFEYPKYEGMKYLCEPVQKLEENVYDYIFNITNSRFLAEGSDIDLFISDSNVLNEINDSCLMLGITMFSLLSPKFINAKELVRIGDAEIVYSSSSNRSIKSIDSMVEYLNKTIPETFKNVSIELYNYDKLCENSNMHLKNVISSHNNKDLYNLANYSQYELIQYLRKIYNEPLSKYDSIVDIDNSQIKIIYSEELQWCN